MDRSHNIHIIVNQDYGKNNIIKFLDKQIYFFELRTILKTIKIREILNQHLSLRVKLSRISNPAKTKVWFL